jgi:hypothetical protein
MFPTYFLQVVGYILKSITDYAANYRDFPQSLHEKFGGHSELGHYFYLPTANVVTI